VDAGTVTHVVPAPLRTVQPERFTEEGVSLRISTHSKWGMHALFVASSAPGDWLSVHTCTQLKTERF
jgi:hypothetical protein